MKESERDSNPEVEAQGSWWLPEREETKAPGHLRVDEKGATLELVGSLQFPEPKVGEIVRGYVVFGQDKHGRAITLLDASPTLREMGAGTDAQSVRAWVVLVGDSHPSPSPTFGQCSFSLEGLSEWTEAHFGLLNSMDQGSQLEHMDDGGRFEVQLPAGSLTLSEGIAETFSGVERSFRAASAWLYRPKEPKSFDAIWREAIRPLEYMHVLLTSESTKPFDIRLQLPSAGGDFDFLKVYAIWAPDKQTERRRAFEWPVRLSEVAHRFPALVTSWFELIQANERALLLLFSVLEEDRPLFLENRYLMLTQAAEAFHRSHAIFPKRILDEDEFDRRVSQLRELAKREGWWGEWLKPKVSYAYEPTFRQRLRDLINRVGEFGDRLGLGSAVVDRIVFRRNELTHVLDTQEASDESYAELVTLGQKLALLLRACLFVELGFRTEELTKTLIRTQFDSYAADYRAD